MSSSENGWTNGSFEGLALDKVQQCLPDLIIGAVVFCGRCEFLQMSMLHSQVTPMFFISFCMAFRVRKITFL